MMATQPGALNGGIYKAAAGFFAGIVLAGVAQWFMLGRTVVVKEDMEKYVQSYSPYARDRDLLQERLRELASADEELKIKLNLINVALSQMQQEISILKAQLEGHRKESLKHYQIQEQELKKPGG